MVDSVGDGGCCFWDLLAHVYEVGVAVFFGAFLLCVLWLVLSVVCWRDWVRLRGAADWERRGLMWRVFFEMALWGFLTAKVMVLSV